MHLDIFTTGGTIDKTYFDAKSEYEIGESQIDIVLKEAAVAFDYRITALCHKDSLDLTEQDRERIHAAVADCESDRVLITHGTDAMAATAERLRDIEGKTIVLTGALAPARFRVSDAFFNIGGAVASVQSLGHGVYLFMNGRVFEAGRVRKNRERGRFESV
jgi:L-asparaginase